ncbi:MAG TPA: sugar phosphate isomerase/epimerase [Candidatus Merdenecus merdavium]|nr:sugar phosphate isomerase/epimerase [Candidatus Merdenecus merdavium]
MVDLGFESFELTFHMSLEGTDLKALAQKTKEIIGDRDISISSIGLYCNPIQYQEHQKSLEYVIDHASDFGATVVNTFAGAYEGKPVEDAITKFGEVFGELTKRAAHKNIKIGIENCPMGGSYEAATCNIGFNPKAWEKMFNQVPAENLGLEWEPTHQMVQLIDPIAQLKEWVGKVVHIHGKDATIDYDGIKKFGIFGAKDFVYHRTPGYGDSNWTDIISILQGGGYEGDICIEGYHDPIYGGEWELTSQLHGLEYLKWCRGGAFKPCPWMK